jgi:hypothetical protein
MAKNIHVPSLRKDRLQKQFTRKLVLMVAIENPAKTMVETITMHH